MGADDVYPYPRPEAASEAREQMKLAPRAWLTPHVASRGKEGVLRSFLQGIANIRGFIEGGRTPANILNPQARPDLRKAGATPAKV